MRLLIILVCLVFAIGMTGFVLMNLDATVPVKIGSTLYADLPLYRVVIVAVLVGIVVAAIIAIAEGANIRLANRRMRREIHQLETEINYLRTQPPAVAAPEPDALQQERPPARARGTSEARSAPPSAPVYAAEDDAWPSDDDDTYSGGTAV